MAKRNNTTVKHVVETRVITNSTDAFIAAGTWVNDMILAMNGQTIDREDAKLVARMVELHLSGCISEFQAA